MGGMIQSIFWLKISSIMYVPLKPFADLIKLAGSLVERAPDEGFTDVSCLAKLFVCYPNFSFLFSWRGRNDRNATRKESEFEQLFNSSNIYTGFC